jgi:hypothetical protein
VSETILLDPTAITGGSRVEVQISGDGDGAIEVIGTQGVNWGDSEIEAIMAKQAVGANVVDFEIPNRIIEMKIKLQPSGDVTFAQARSMLQAKVAQIQAEGGWISREMPGVGTVYADLVNAKLNLPGSWMQAHRDRELEATLSLEAIPDFYEADWIEVAFTDVQAGENHWRGLIDNVEGDFPKGNRCKVVVTGDPDNDQLGLRAAFRRRHYSADPTAACFLQAQSLEPLDLASVVTLSGASGGVSNNAVRHNNLGTSWTPVLGLRLVAGDYLTHTGSYRLVARVYTTSPTPPELRFVYDVGDLVNPSENAPVRIPGAGSFYLVDLGSLRLDRGSVGEHRWLGQIQARGAAGGENIYVDTVDLWSTDEYYARVATPVSPWGGFSVHLARDEFNQAAGALTGKVLPIGGQWTGVTGSDADDFTVDLTNHRAQRAATNDGAARIVTAGSTNHALVAVSVDLGYTPSLPALNNLVQGVVARVSAIGTYCTAQLNHFDGRTVVSLEGYIASAQQFVYSRPVTFLPPGSLATLLLLVTDTGRAVVLYGPAGGRLAPILHGHHPSLANGGGLATGQVGLRDRLPDSGATGVRIYDNFAVWTPNVDAVVFAGRAVELRTNGAFRASADGISSGVLVPSGNHPRLPQGGPIEVMAATSRGDLDQLPDSGLDTVSASLLYRPCWLTVRTVA